MAQEENKSRLTRLKELRDKLETAIENCESMRDLAALSRQYRETIREIEDIEGTYDDEDEIESLLAERKANGSAGSVRKNRAKV